MCGLVGVFGHPSPKLMKMGFELIQIDVVRGEDSTGILSVIDDEPKISKCTGIPHHLFGNKDFRELMKDRNTVDKMTLFMGHNRAATKGDVNLDNAHPFQHGKIIMAHNGTIHNIHPLKLDKEFDTDSEHVAYALSKKDPQWVWHRNNGAAALSWYDVETKSLNLLRNNKRPLSVAWSEDRKYVIYASESWMIRGVTARAGVKLREDAVYSINIDQLFTFRFNHKKQRVTWTSKKIEDWNYQIAYPQTGHGAHVTGTGFRNNANGWSGQQASVSKLPAPAGGDTNHGEVVANPRAKALGGITKERFNESYKKCALCGHNLQDEHEESVIIDDKLAACSECAATADVHGVQFSKGFLLSAMH